MQLRSRGLNWLFVCTLPALLVGCPRDDGFENHLDEAINLYEIRKVLYGEMTDGQSDALFELLMTTERAIKPVARYVDWRATPFINEGIPIVVDDFVPMDSARDVYDPIDPVMPISNEVKDEMRRVMATFRCIDKDDFARIAATSYSALLQVDALEIQYHVYLPMLRHVIESIGFGALHAVQYAADSDGETIGLSQEFMSVQILGLSEPIVVFDSLANEMHQQGVGVLVNDLPFIPFVEEYEQSDLSQ